MAPTANFLAIDLGAESGRAVLGHFDGGRLSLRDIHRFPNGPVRILNSIFWDAPRLLSEIKQGLRMCAAEGTRLEGIGLDTWGVDFGLLGRGDVLLGNPYHYRDERTNGMIEEACRRVPREEIFEHTGIQFMQLNTLFQLLAMSVQKSPLLEMAETLLMMPDLFNFWLTGRKVSEFSIATTTQFYDPRKHAWATALLEKLGLPTAILPEIVDPGTVLGPLHPSVADDVGLQDVQVIAPACHDTGSAVAAVPLRDENAVYLSSGTWSLIGAELPEPLINEKALAYNFTNEGGVCGTIRFLKNIMGLWLVQESRRTWEREGDKLSYDAITQMASEAPPFTAFVEPDDASFLPTGDMPARIRAFCERTGQRPPESRGEVVRVALESLAMKYRWVLERMEELLGRPASAIHIVGGGSQNRLLSQFTANATKKQVLCGPVEATALGNVIMQAIATGRLASLEEGREVIRNSFDLEEYQPRETGAWDDAYARYLKIAEKAKEK
jgi:rhamnulokinase